MLYKFDILFEKKLKSGSTKVVSYRQILEDHSVFDGESLDGAQGHLSTVRDGMEKGYSLNSLYLKYRNELFGKAVSEMCPEGLNLFFDFSDYSDPTSLQLNLFDSEDRIHSSSFVECRSGKIVKGFESRANSFFFICLDDKWKLENGERSLIVNKGELLIDIGDNNDNSLSTNYIGYC